LQVIRSNRLRPCAVLVATIGSLLSAAPAFAAERYASTTSTDKHGSCTQAAPCRIDHAINDAAGGDDVVILPGEYHVNLQLDATEPISIHGVAGQPRPRLLGDPKLGSTTLSVSSGGSVSHLYIQSDESGEKALELQGATGDDLVVVASEDSAAVLNTDSSPTILRDALVQSTSSGGAGLVVQGGYGSAPVSVVNVTAVGSTGLRLKQIGSTPRIRNSILNGSTSDIEIGGGGTSADIDFSNFRPSTSTGFQDGGHNQSAPPVFVDAGAGDFHEAAGSPTIDAGTAVDPDIGPRDPDGNPRAIGAGVDIGAFESGGPYTGKGSGTNGIAPGSGAGDDDTSGSISSPPTTPVAGKSINVSEVSGSVLVKLPGRGGFFPLGQAVSLPVGTVIDTRNGVVAITTARDASGTPQTGEFWGGVFRVLQPKSAHPITELRLVGSLPTGCRSRARAAGGPHSRRYLWGRDHNGRFRTRGRNAVATVRGTVWRTTDTCAGTQVTVKQGAVSVKNLRTHKSVLVKAGRSYTAR
jgi:hypothetical protein